MHSETMKKWTPADIPSQAGKRILITGANSGIGWYTALELARAGAEVTLPARSISKSNDAAERIRKEVPLAKLKTAVLDLANLASVRAFAAEELKDPRPIDVLINNAGVMALPKRKLTVDGFEVQFGTNVVGHFLLTGLLLPLILKATAPRVINVSSSAHSFGKIELDNLNGEKKYSAWPAYAQTKLANILFTRELVHRYGPHLMSASCHPGFSRTNLQFANTGLRDRIGVFLFMPISQTAKKGAEPTLFAAAAPEAKSLSYYGPDGLFGMRGDVKEANPTERAKDDSVAKQLFDRLEEMTGFRYPSAS